MSGRFRWYCPTCEDGWDRDEYVTAWRHSLDHQVLTLDADHGGLVADELVAPPQGVGPRTWVRLWWWRRIEAAARRVRLG